MEKIPTWTPVVALALSDPQGRVFLAQRPAGKHHGGLWEFPGGKVEAGENPRGALVREVAEELGLMLDPQALVPAGFADRGGESPIVLFLYTSRQPARDLNVSEHADWGWFDRAAAADLPLAPLDRELLAKLAPLPG